MKWCAVVCLVSSIFLALGEVTSASPQTNGGAASLEQNSTEPYLQNSQEFWTDNERLDQLFRSRNVTDYKARVAELKAKWASAPDRRPLYALERRITNQLSSSHWDSDQRSQSRQLAADIALSVLQSNDAPLGIVVYIEWALPPKLNDDYSNTSMSGSQWVGERKEFAELLLATLKRLEDERDPAFDPSRTPAPGIDNSIYMGNDPEILKRISDTRKKNADYSKWYNYQADLHNWLNWWKFSTIPELAHAYSEAPRADDELRDLLGRYVKDDSVSQSILSRLPVSKITGN